VAAAILARQRSKVVLGGTKVMPTVRAVIDKFGTGNGPTVTATSNGG
jgi:hypothetical protein